MHAAHIRPFAAILLALGLTLAALHPPVGRAAPLDPALAVFLALGGDEADLCGGDATEAGPHCEACRLPAAILALSPVRLARKVPGALLRRGPAVRARAAWARRAPRPALPRAPPVGPFGLS